MRKKAQDKGNLKSNEQQKVETQVVETKSVIVIEQANPQVVYVPTSSRWRFTVRQSTLIPPIYYPRVVLPRGNRHFLRCGHSDGDGVKRGAAGAAGAAPISTSTTTTTSFATRTLTAPRSYRPEAGEISAVQAELVALAELVEQAESVA